MHAVRRVPPVGAAVSELGSGSAGADTRGVVLAFSGKPTHSYASSQMNMSNMSAHPSALQTRLRPRARLIEKLADIDGPGRAIERWWLFLWRWETWASESELARRPRAGWSLTYRQALIASQDALDDYELSPV